MDRLQAEIDELLRRLPNEQEFRARLDNLVSMYPFNEYEYIISTLLAKGVLSLTGYQKLREAYVARSPYLPLFEITAPRGFGEAWGHKHLQELIPELQKPTKKLDPRYTRQQYDFLMDGRIRIEVKASRAVLFRCRAPLYAKALSSNSTKPFDMNFQQSKPACCDVFVWIAVWRDAIRYWVFASREVKSFKGYSGAQHRGNVGEGQLHLRQENIKSFKKFEKDAGKLRAAIRAAYKRQLKKKWGTAWQSTRQ